MFVLSSPARAAESWEAALALMPLKTNVTVLTKTNVAAVLLDAFQANPAVKALVLQPGATDEFYFFNRGRTVLTNSVPSLLDALVALTNQTAIRLTHLPPFLLLHTHEDPATPMVQVQDEAVARKLREKKFAPHFYSNDKDWNYVQPILRKHFSSKLTGYPIFLPPVKSMDSWHFFRHAITAWDLNGMEALEAISLANKTVVRIEKRRVVFEGDTRAGGGSPAK
ncbi:MAG: hypothetical protein HZA89_18425 [Verrucomicrobia bacterium]|nr:hypothetical protein [Verrucomicrobiota bacterium]